MNNGLKEFRESLGITQAKMASELQVSFSYYSKVEQGFKTPGFAFLKKLKAKFPEYDMNGFFA